MYINYIIRRLVVFVLVVWIAVTINFFIPKLSGRDPVRERLAQRSLVGGSVQQGMEEMIQEYNEKFGLNEPLLKQYATYFADTIRLEFNYSIASYPKPVKEIIASALPWTIGLFGTTTLLTFILGSTLGALLAWPRAPRFLNYIAPPLLALSAVPYFLLGLVLVYIFAFRFRLFPIFGGYSPGTTPQMTWAFVGNVLRHSVLPAASIILSAIGFWALAMRGMMVTVLGEDFMILAEAKGLKGRNIFLHYAIRNAILPQTTSLALAMGFILSGSVLVEVVFGYPGIGSILFRAIKDSDYFVIQGVVFIIIISIASATLILDLILPLLDPRIVYEKS